MSLLSAPQLQKMFYPTEKFISTAEVVKILATQVTLVMQLLQREHGPTGAQPFFSPAIDALKALDKKFDIADAAAVDLDVDAARLECCLFATCADLLQRFERGLDGGKVDLLGVDARLNSADELPCQSLVSRRVTNLDQRLQLPIVRHLGVVTQRRLDGDRGLAFVALRSQTQIDAEDRSLITGAREDLGGQLR